MSRAARLIELAYLLNRKTPIPLRDLVEALERAIARGRAVSIRYVSLSGKTERWRGVDPYQVFHRGDAWYLVGRCHLNDEPRTFRLDRIRGLRPFGRRFQIPEDFSLDEYLKDVSSVFRGKRRHQLEPSFDRLMRRRIDLLDREKRVLLSEEFSMEIEEGKVSRKWLRMGPIPDAPSIASLALAVYSIEED